MGSREPTWHGWAWERQPARRWPGPIGLRRDPLSGLGRGFAWDPQPARRWPSLIGLRGDPLSGVGWGFAVAAGLAGQGLFKTFRGKSKERLENRADLRQLSQDTPVSWFGAPDSSQKSKISSTNAYRSWPSPSLSSHRAMPSATARHSGRPALRRPSIKRSLSWGRRAGIFAL